MRLVVITVAFVGSIAGSATAQVPACSDQPVNNVAENRSTNKPVGFDTVVVGTEAGAAIQNGDLGAVGANWTKQQADTFQTLHAMDKTRVLVWSNATKTASCFQKTPDDAPAVVSPAKAPPAGGGAGRYDEDDCALAGGEWLTRLTKSPGARVTVILFKEDTGVCYQNTDRPTQGDPIHVGVFTSDRAAWDGVRATFEPCALEPTSPAILVSGQLPPTLLGQQSTDWILREYPQHSCWNSSVVITVQGKGKQVSHTLAQATRYRATLHIGTIFSDSHEVTFGLRPEGGVNKIFAEGPSEQGPEYVAALVFYSVLKYVPAMFGGPSYPGRDPIRDNTFFDKLGAVVGVGLKSPTKRFVTGFSFEIAAGVNVIGVWDWGQTNALAGVKEDDTFSGTKDLIPIRKEWRQQWVWGVSLDILYATTALRR
jgi:hypothetical protein